jgi:hypothetical protein
MPLQPTVTVDGPFAAAGCSSPPRSAQARAHLSLSSFSCCVPEQPYLDGLSLPPLPPRTPLSCAASHFSLPFAHADASLRERYPVALRLSAVAPFALSAHCHLALALSHGFCRGFEYVSWPCSILARTDVVFPAVDCPFDSRRTQASCCYLVCTKHVVSPNRTKTLTLSSISNQSRRARIAMRSRLET